MVVEGWTDLFGEPVFRLTFPDGRMYESSVPCCFGCSGWSGLTWTSCGLDGSVNLGCGLGTWVRGFTFSEAPALIAVFFRSLLDDPVSEIWVGFGVDLEASVLPVDEIEVTEDTESLTPKEDPPLLPGSLILLPGRLTLLLSPSQVGLVRPESPMS